ncbi:hypothetical protein D0T53_10300 [Dysgonomonas sp. 216]|uniref:hypothetical protein n=1 Tax=Dysgonomonas sp. 216 TaxID=2302934 RepID=UPI0013CFC709|nr:hypothetical protein [Dysgonomonas sp. 216]NDW19302.1 hypothetical protein [Dysgonomonas sp. 216]
MISGNKFFDGWAVNAGIGFAQGANSGYQLSKKNGLNYWWGKKVMDGRTQWSFFTSEKPYFSSRLSIKSVSVTGKNVCIPETLFELEKSKGGTRTLEDFKKSTNWKEDVGVVLNKDKESYSNFIAKQGFENEVLNVDDIGNVAFVQSVTDNNQNITIVYERDGIRHAINARGVDFYRSGKTKILGREENLWLKDLNSRERTYYFLIK